MEGKKQLHIFYSGRVQGVGFRYTAEDTARHHGLTGWVRNLQDGRVELLAEGGETALLEFLTAMENGPLGNHVSHVESSWHEATGEFARFTMHESE